jgi:hypothetical protein
LFVDLASKKTVGTKRRMLSEVTTVTGSTMLKDDELIEQVTTRNTRWLHTTTSVY